MLFSKTLVQLFVFVTLHSIYASAFSISAVFRTKTKDANFEKGVRAAVAQSQTKAISAIKNSLSSSPTLSALIDPENPIKIVVVVTDEGFIQNGYKKPTDVAFIVPIYKSSLGKTASESVKQILTHVQQFGKHAPKEKASWEAFAGLDLSASGSTPKLETGGAAGSGGGGGGAAGGKLTRARTFRRREALYSALVSRGFSSRSLHVRSRKGAEEN